MERMSELPSLCYHPKFGWYDKNYFNFNMINICSNDFKLVLEYPYNLRVNRHRIMHYKWISFEHYLLFSEIDQSKEYYFFKQILESRNEGQQIYLILKPLSLCIYLTYFLFFICLIKKVLPTTISQVFKYLLSDGSITWYRREWSVCNCVSLHELDNWSCFYFCCFGCCIICLHVSHLSLIFRWCLHLNFWNYI